MLGSRLWEVRKLQSPNMGRRPHVLAVPFPAQGHVTPLMRLSHQIADRGIKVTFVSTEFMHAKLMAAMAEGRKEEDGIELVSIPDGLEPEEDRRDAMKLVSSVKRVMPAYLKDLIAKKCMDGEDEKVTCVIADATIGWVLGVAEEMGVKQQAAFWPSGPGGLALILHIPKLIEEGIIDLNGTAIKNELICLSKEIPLWSSDEFNWSCKGDPKTQRVFFECALAIKRAAQYSNLLLCNTFYELDSSACHLIPNILPVGPLLTSNCLRHSRGSFRHEDSTCLSWLDQQPANSVVYVAFGSITMVSQTQHTELALGLDLAGHPFLWVAKPGLIDGSVAQYPEGFMERVRGKIVEWAPQENVLAHPSVACFITHCGWNSTMEGLSMGVPLLCWPHFGDQFHNQSYICDTWKVGLRLNPNENGVVSRYEIQAKIENLLSDDAMKANVLQLKEVSRESVKEGGSSSKNLESFIEHLKH